MSFVIFEACTTFVLTEKDNRYKNKLRKEINKDFCVY